MNVKSEKDNEHQHNHKLAVDLSTEKTPRRLKKMI